MFFFLFPEMASGLFLVISIWGLVYLFLAFYNLYSLVIILIWVQNIVVDFYL